MNEVQQANKFEWLTLAIVILTILLTGILSSWSAPIVQFVVGAGLVTVICQALIKSIFDKRVETYRSELAQTALEYKSGLDKTLETLKADLNLANAKQGKPHEKRGKVIAELYAKLVDLHQAMSDLTQVALIVPLDSERAENERQEKLRNLEITTMHF